MPFNRSPYIQTYETKRVEFPTNPLGRSGLTPLKDASLLNIMVDVTKGFKQPQVYYRSRAGLSKAYSSPAGVGRGIFYWNYSGTSYAIYVIGSNVYANGTLLTTISTSTGPVGFTLHLSSAGVVTLFLADGTNGYLFANPTSAPTTISTSTDSNFPSPHVPFPVFLDGYVFLAKTGPSGDVYNCQLDTPTVWTISGSAAGFLSAEMYADSVVALTKNNNYIFAIGTNSVQYFYDAGNSPGTPLANQAPGVQQFGSSAPYSVVQTEQEVILVGNTANGGNTVWSITGFKAKEIGTTWVKAILTTEGANLVNASAYSTRVSGQKLYVLQLTNRTLVYNIDTELWSEWSSASGRFIGLYGSDGINGVPYVLDATSGNVYLMSSDVYTDNGTNFTCQIITDKQDFGTIDRKTCSRFALVCDIPDASFVNNLFTIYWSDDDYNTWSAARTLSYNNDFPIITQLGVFRRRAFKIQFSGNYLVRLEGYELNLNKGSR